LKFLDLSHKLCLVRGDNSHVNGLSSSACSLCPEIFLNPQFNSTEQELARFNEQSTSPTGLKWQQILVSSIIFANSTVFANSHHPQDFLNSITGSKNEGKEIVQHYCAVCHSEKPLIQLGAPRIGVKSDWEIRLKQGMRKLFQNTSQGLNAMPVRGGCFECSDEQLKLAIEAMLEND